MCVFILLLFRVMLSGPDLSLTALTHNKTVSKTHATFTSYLRGEINQSYRKHTLFFSSCHSYLEIGRMLKTTLLVYYKHNY